MYAEIAWVLVSLGTQVQLEVILDPDYLPDYHSVSYVYVFSKWMDFQISLSLWELHVLQKKVLLKILQENICVGASL